MPLAPSDRDHTDKENILVFVLRGVLCGDCSFGFRWKKEREIRGHACYYGKELN
jgi:hypothetical protein